MGRSGVKNMEVTMGIEQPTREIKFKANHEDIQKTRSLFNLRVNAYRRKKPRKRKADFHRTHINKEEILKQSIQTDENDLI